MKQESICSEFSLNLAHYEKESSQKFDLLRSKSFTVVPSEDTKSVLMFQTSQPSNLVPSMSHTQLEFATIDHEPKKHFTNERIVKPENTAGPGTPFGKPKYALDDELFNEEITQNTDIISTAKRHPQGIERNMPRQFLATPAFHTSNEKSNDQGRKRKASVPTLISNPTSTTASNAKPTKKSTKKGAAKKLTSSSTQKTLVRKRKS